MAPPSAKCLVISAFKHRTHSSHFYLTTTQYLWTHPHNNNISEPIPTTKQYLWTHPHNNNNISEPTQI